MGVEKTLLMLHRSMAFSYKKELQIIFNHSQSQIFVHYTNNMALNKSFLIVIVLIAAVITNSYCQVNNLSKKQKTKFLYFFFFFYS